MIELATLIIKQTKAAIYDKGLEVATALGLPVTSWQAGDPTRSMYHILAEILSNLEDVVGDFISAGFLDYSSGDWLTILAKQVYNVDRTEATYATTTVTLTNAGGGVFDFDDGDIIAKNSSTEKTYRSTTGGHLGAGGTLAVTVVADESGSDSSAGAGEIDDLVTTFLGVTVTNATAAVGIDAETDASLRQRCRDKLASLSPNGPKEAYEFVALDPTLTGTTGVTRVRVSGDASTGEVDIFLAGPSGAPTSDDRDAVEAAILQNATPLGFTPIVVNATPHEVDVTYEVWIYSSANATDGEVKAAITAALEDLFAVRPIGGDIIAPAVTGKIYKSIIESAIRSAFPDDIFHVSVSAPAADVSLDIVEVATLGDTTTGCLVHFEDPP